MGKFPIHKNEWLLDFISTYFICLPSTEKIRLLDSINLQTTKIPQEKLEEGIELGIVQLNGNDIELLPKAKLLYFPILKEAWEKEFFRFGSQKWAFKELHYLLLILSADLSNFSDHILETLCVAIRDGKDKYFNGTFFDKVDYSIISEENKLFLPTPTILSYFETIKENFPPPPINRVVNREYALQIQAWSSKDEIVRPAAKKILAEWCMDDSDPVTFAISLWGENYFANW